MRLFEIVSYNDIKDDIQKASKRLVDDIDNYSSLQFEYDSWFHDRYYVDLSEEDYGPHDVQEAIEEHPEWKEWYDADITDWAEQRVGDAYETLNYNLKSNEVGDKVRLYREITVPNVDSINFDDIGIYWSFSDTPEHQWGDDDHKCKVVMSALVDKKTIDWPSALYQNANPAFEEEMEVTLQPGKQIEIVKAVGNCGDRDFELEGFPKKAMT